MESHDRAVRTVRHLDGESQDVLISYRWNYADNGHLEPIKDDIVDDAIERLLRNAPGGAALSSPIKVCVEHGQMHRSHHEPLTMMRYVKVYLDGCGAGMVIAY
jgi:hypothetical protein